MILSRYLLRLCAPLLTAMLAACATAAPVGPGPFTLLPQASAMLEGGVTLTYDGYSDSRCPPGVQCVWAGRLALRFNVHGPDGDEAFTLGPDRPRAAPHVLHGRAIVLDAAALPPARGQAAQRTDGAMPVTLRVLAR